MVNGTNNRPRSSGNKTQKSRRRKKSSVFKTLFLLIVLFVLLGIAGAVVAGTIFIIKLSDDLPTTSQLTTHRINVPSVIYDRNNEVIAKLFTENRNPVELRDISPWMIKAILAAEDSDFYSHMGISVKGIMRALWMDLRQKLFGEGSLQGASTITQQLARNLYLSQERILERKIKEILISFKLEEIYSKDKILEMYLNTIYFGRGAWGIDTAAHTYFGKPASDLNIAESAILAGIIPAPNRYNPVSNLPRAKSRQSYVLERMGVLGWLNDSQIQQAKGEELEFKRISNKVEEFNRAPYFVSHILFNDLLPKYGTDRVYGGGMEIFTTLDIRLQDKAQEAVSKLKNQGALVAIEPATGEVVALVGGKDFNESKFNRATQAYRQPGSSFKPFIYGAAIEKGLSPSDHFMDSKLVFKIGSKTWSPGNYDGKFSGEVTMVNALTRSLNTVPVRCISHIGVTPVIDFARKCGITTEYLAPNLSIALGSASVTPIEMALAFSVFANAGRRADKPVMIREIRSWTGEVLERNEADIIQAIRPETSWTMLSMLCDVVAAGTGSRAAIPKTRVFGKTGTTNDFIDAWFIGGAPGLVASVYTGNDDNTPIGRGMTGGVAAAPAWKEFMSYAVTAMELESDFGAPAPIVNVDRVSICRTTGFRSVKGCRAVSLYFESGTAPTSTCPVHGGNGTSQDDNAPRLIRIDQDANLVSEYENPTRETVPEDESANINMNNMGPLQIPAPLPQPPVNTPQEIDAKYEQLLKEYGIKD